MKYCHKGFHIADVLTPGANKCPVCKGDLRRPIEREEDTDE